jgi:hypothetical protein
MIAMPNIFDPSFWEKPKPQQPQQPQNTTLNTTIVADKPPLFDANRITPPINIDPQFHAFGGGGYYNSEITTAVNTTLPLISQPVINNSNVYSSKPNTQTITPILPINSPILPAKSIISTDYSLYYYLVGGLLLI